jgi:hypothetical protein
VLANALTGLIGTILMKVIEKTCFGGVPRAQIEDLFSHLELGAPALANREFQGWQAITSCTAAPRIAGKLKWVLANFSCDRQPRDIVYSTDALATARHTSFEDSYPDYSGAACRVALYWDACWD